MPIKKNNTYYEEDNGKVYYYDNNDVKKEIPASAFSNLYETKYDVSSFEEVSSTFYTTANPSGFITSSVQELDNFYDKATINSMLADFGGFEVVPLTTGVNPVPDVDKPKTTIIYLTKDSEKQVKDPYTEWIFTSANISTTAWEVIGETTVDLTNYYNKTETSGANEISAALDKKENKLTAGTNLTFIEVSNEIKSAKITHIKEMDGSEITEDFSFPGFWISYPDHSTMTCTCELKIEFKHQLDYYTNIILTLPDEHSETGQDKTVELKTLSVGDNIFSAPQDQPNFTINVKEIGTDYITFNGLTMPYQILLLKSLTTSPADVVKIIKTNDHNCVSDSELNNFAVGIETSAINSGAAFAEGYKTLASGFAAHAEGYESSAVEEAAHAEGSYTLASGRWSHTEGQMTSANADYSHAEGRITLASGMGSHAEGYQTKSLYDYTHSEGNNTKANNVGAHAEGQNTSANGYYSHTEGGYTLTRDNYSHAEGYYTSALGNYSHSEGRNTSAEGEASHSEGYRTSAYGGHSHAEGYDTIANGGEAHAEGYGTTASGDFSHAEGYTTIALFNAHAEGYSTLASGGYSHAEGYRTSALGGTYGSHAEGHSTIASATDSHAEGEETQALGIASHTEGYLTTAVKANAHAEGFYTLAQGAQSHAEGERAIAFGGAAHAEGIYTTAAGNYTHAEGEYTMAGGYDQYYNPSGEAAHAEGYHTTALAPYSHAGGYFTVATTSAMTVIGKYNNPNLETSASFAIGNGSSEQNRSDSFIVNWDGTVSAKKFIEEETPLAITGGDYVSVTEDTSNNKLIIDLNSEMGTMLTELSGVLSVKPSTGRHILGVDGGTLTWLEDN